MILLALLLQPAAIDEAALTKATQARVDQIVDRCSARSFVTLQADGPTQVIIQLRRFDPPPSPVEQQQFECVLGGMKSMPDLQFGWLGNEAAPEPEAD